MKDLYFYDHDKEYREFSNFWPSPFSLDGLEWPTVEHYYQANKTTDSSQREDIRKAKTASEAKQKGREANLRSDWAEIKDEIMLKALRAKFSQNPDLANILLDTGESRLHEGSSDPYWGIAGKDKLGKLLEQIRDDLRQG